MQTVSERIEKFFAAVYITEKMDKNTNSPENGVADGTAQDASSQEQSVYPPIPPPSYNNVIQQQAEIISNWNAQKDANAPTASAVTVQPMPNSQVWSRKTKTISKAACINKHLKVPPVPADFNYQLFSCLEEPTMCLKAIFIPCWSFYGVHKLVDDKKETFLHILSVKILFNLFLKTFEARLHTSLYSMGCILDVSLSTMREFCCLYSPGLSVAVGLCGWFGSCVSK